jgi:hypothetical protein
MFCNSSAMLLLQMKCNAISLPPAASLTPWPFDCRVVLALRKEYLPGGVRKSVEEAKAAAVKAREVRWVTAGMQLPCARTCERKHCGSTTMYYPGSQHETATQDHLTVHM